MTAVRWHDFIPIPLAPVKEFVESEHERSDYEQLLIATGASMAGWRLLVSPYKTPAAGLALMRLSLASAALLPVVAAAAVTAVIEEPLIEEIVTNPSTPSWWKVLGLSGQ
jgi:hypothetical protein